MDQSYTNMANRTRWFRLDVRLDVTVQYKTWTQMQNEEG